MPKFYTHVDPKTTAVIVVDMTNGFCAPGAPIYVEMGYRFAPKLNDFLNQCRQQGLRVLYTTHVYRADGADLNPLARREHAEKGPSLIAGTRDVEIYPVCAPAKGEIVLEKHFYSSFYGTDLDQLLTVAGIQTLVITGVCTDVCCFATARDAMALGYDVVFLADLNGTFSHEDCGLGRFTDMQHHVATLNNLAATNADVMESDTFLTLFD